MQMRLQFIQALGDILKARFPHDKFLDAGACLSPSSWPDDENQRALFGDQQVVNLAKLCHVNAIEALTEFREYKNNIRRIGKTLQALFHRICLLPISSAECERGFSCMNANHSDVRNQLSIDTLSALLFVKVNGPPPSLFNPIPYVEMWLRDGHHASADKPTGKESECKDTLTPVSSLFI